MLAVPVGDPNDILKLVKHLDIPNNFMSAFLLTTRSFLLENFYEKMSLKTLETLRNLYAQMPEPQVPRAL